MNVKPLLATAALLLAASACDTAPIDKADASPPAVQIQLRKPDGQYAPATTATLKGSQLELLAMAEDSKGVRSLRVDFTETSSKTCTVGSSVWEGNFPLQGLPQPIEQTLSGNKEGEVLTKLPLWLQVPPGLKCTVFGQPGQGRPIGHVFTVRATAKNWGQSAPVVATLKVTIQ